MKIMTLNLNTYQEDNQREKFNQIAKKIVDEDLDIICFCEAAQTFMSSHVDEYVRQDNAVKLICDEVNRILGKKTYNFIWDLSHYGFKIYEEGIALMSKHPISNIATQYVSHTQDIFTFKSRKILKATVHNNGKEFDVYSCQLGWEDDEYEPFSDQFKRLDEWIEEESKNKMIILCGDFSNDALSASYQQIIQAGYVDQYVLGKPDGMYDETFIYPTGFENTHANKSLRLDYIFTKSFDFKVKTAKRMFLPTERVSDHMAVMVEWEIE